MIKPLHAFFLLLGALTFFCLAPPSQAAEKGGEWVRVPSKWLLHRFVRPSTSPAKTYRVALAVPPAASLGAAKPQVVQSSGLPDVDMLARDFALESIRKNRSLRDLMKAKELYFQLSITPPALDIAMRSKAGREPVPEGQELYAPVGEWMYLKPNQEEPTKQGELTVIFPPQGGYAIGALVTASSGSAAIDGYYAHNSALNWQVRRKSDTEQILRRPFTVRGPQRWESVGF